MSALLTGIMAGVVIFILAKNNIGFLTIIPVFFAYKKLTSNRVKEMNETLKF